MLNVGILVSENRNVLPENSVSSFLSFSSDACGYLISFVFYLSRSRSPRCFALTASSALLIESYGVSVGMSSAAASHSHIY